MFYAHVGRISLHWPTCSSVQAWHRPKAPDTTQSFATPLGTRTDRRHTEVTVQERIRTISVENTASGHVLTPFAVSVTAAYSQIVRGGNFPPSLKPSRRPLSTLPGATDLNIAVLVPNMSAAATHDAAAHLPDGSELRRRRNAGDDVPQEHEHAGKSQEEHGMNADTEYDEEKTTGRTPDGTRGSRLRCLYRTFG